ncbi:MULTISPECIES: hypothetical protein [Marinitoga]|uniref:hypothetical protein n=1 Tax=Marinitoga TaxID=160798 RepID=UPI001493EE02|nr:MULTISPECIES: hypothetical protein [Marinitoga]
MYYLISLILLSVISTIYPHINFIISRVNYPLDIVFVDLRNNYLLTIKNRDYLNILENKIVESTKSYSIKTKETNISLSLTPGIYINEDERYIYIKSSKNVRKNSICFSKENIISGFVEENLRGEIVVQKLGWGKREFFGRYDGYDILIKETGNGNLIIHIPEGIKLFENGKNYKILISYKNWLQSKVYIKGTAYIKSNTSYFFKNDIPQADIFLFSELEVE